MNDKNEDICITNNTEYKEHGIEYDTLLEEDGENFSEENGFTNETIVVSKIKYRKVANRRRDFI